MVKNSEITGMIKIPGKTRAHYLPTFNCRQCKKQIHAARVKLKKHTGLCRICNLRGKPYQYIYSALKNNAKKSDRTVMSYKEFITFTAINKCHYCKDKITWLPHIVERKYYSSYMLDRKDSSLGYTKNNCVVCCFSCNQMKSNKYSYEEFLLLSSGLVEIKRRRNAKKATRDVVLFKNNNAAKIQPC